MSEQPSSVETIGPDVAERQITGVVADDHPVVRPGLRQLFDAEGDIEVVTEADDETARRYGPRTTRTCS